MHSKKFDLGIIVPLGEEFRVLCELCKVTPLEIRDAIQYYGLDLPDYRAVAVVLGEMGKNVASQLTEKMLAHFDLNAIVLLGIAGAIDKNLKLGDVVVADEINDFQAAAKAVQKGKSFELQYSGSHWKTDFAIRRCAGNIEFACEELYAAWRNQVRAFRTELGIGVEYSSLVNDVPEARVGHIASGDIVGASEAYSVELRGIDRKFLAIEMEAAGFAQAAHGRIKPVPTMVVRGISDFADERKKELDAVGSGVWRRYAMYSASAFLFSLFKTPSFRSIILPGIPEEENKEDDGDRETERAEHQLSVELVQLLSERFDKEELRTLCFELGVDYDDLRGEGKTSKARELVKYLERRGRILEIEKVAKMLRPDVDWDDAQEMNDALPSYFLNNSPELRRVGDNSRRAQSLDTQILRVLYGYYQKHRGKPKMGLNQLIKVVQAKRDEVIKCLYGLQEKSWVDYDLTDRAEIGVVWLTPLGLQVAEDVSEH